MNEVINSTRCLNTQICDMSCMQVNILQFAKKESFHGTLAEFIDAYHADKDEALTALKGLRKRRIVSMPPDLLNSSIGVTNYGWRLMGWDKEDGK